MKQCGNVTMKQCNKGNVIILGVLVMAGIVIAGLTVSTLIGRELRRAKEIDDAALAYYAAESGIEKSLYRVRKGGEAPSAIGETFVLANQAQGKTKAKNKESELKIDFIAKGDFKTIDLYNLSNFTENPGLGIKSVTFNQQNEAPVVSYQEWDAQEKKLGPFKLLTSGTVLDPAKAYRISVKAETDNVKDFALISYNQGGAQMEIPIPVTIDALGQFGKSEQTLKVTLASASPLGPVEPPEILPEPPSAPPEVDDVTIAYWDFEPSADSSKLLDKSPYGNDGTLVEMNLATAWVEGRPGRGKALSFDGKGYVEVPLSNELKTVGENGKIFTIEAWIKPQTDTIGFMSIAGLTSPVCYKGGYMLSTYYGHIDFSIIPPRSEGCISHDITGGSLKLNQWYHVAGTYDGQTMRLYINGVLAAKKEVVTRVNPDIPSPFRIGKLTYGTRGSATKPFVGLIDDVRVSIKERKTGLIIPSVDGQVNIIENVVNGSDTMNLGVIDPDLDVTKGANNDTVQVAVITDNGDRETVTLTETSAEGTFAGTLATIDGAVPTANNGKLEITNELITLEYQDVKGLDGQTHRVIDIALANSGPPAGWTKDEYTLAWYPLDRTTDFVVDYSGNGYHGGLHGAGIVRGVTGRLGNAFEFDGSSYIVIPPDHDYIPKALPPALREVSENGKIFSIEAWIYPTPSKDALMGIAGMGGEVCYKSGYMLNTHWGGIVFGITPPRSQGCTVFTVSGPSLKLNQWQHIAGTYDGQTMRLYINGVLAATRDIVTQVNPDALGPLTIGHAIGAEGSATKPFTGRIDEVRISVKERKTGLIIPSVDGQVNIIENVVNGSDTMNLGVIDPDLDVTKGANNDTVQVAVITDNGDRETVTLTETSAEGTFAGTLATIDGAVPTANNGKLEITNELITLEYQDVKGLDGQTHRVIDIALANSGPSSSCTKDDSTIAWYPLDRTSDFVVDYSGHGYYGSPRGTGVTRGVTGKFGKAFEFDGKSYVQIPPYHDYIPRPPHQPLKEVGDNGRAVTIEAWVYPRGTPVSMGIAGTVSNKWQGGGYWLRTYYNSFQFGIKKASDGWDVLVSTWDAVAKTGSLNINQWQHVAGTYDGQTLKIYVNGQLKNSVAFTGAIYTGHSEPFYVGHAPGAAREAFNGFIDEVRVSNTVKQFTPENYISMHCTE